MLNDNIQFNAKGRVKLELYNQEGVFLTREKKNLVVLSANEIVGEAMGDPAKTTRVSQTDKGATAVAATGAKGFAFDLSTKRFVETSYEADLGAANTVKTVTVPFKLIDQLTVVKVGATDLVIDKDVFLKDADEGILEFAAAPVQPIHIELRYKANPYVEIVQGTEVVKVGGVTFNRGQAASNALSSYTIDYKTGKLFFETAKSDVQVTYDFKVRYGLSFMGIGTKPVDHPDYKPVEFSKADKLKQFMDQEFTTSRQLIQYPAVIGKGAPEADILPAKPIAFETITATFTAADADTNGTVDMIYDIDNSGRNILKLVSAKNTTTNTNLVVGTDIKINDKVAGKVELTVVPVAAQNFEIVYQRQLNNDYLIYNLSEAPVMELVTVVHEDVNGNLKNYTINKKGLAIGDGEVWLLNPNQGIVQFSANPVNGAKVETPGQLTFTYRINSGTTVQYVADFPKGVPGPVQTTASQVLPASDTMTTYPVQHAIAKGADGKFIAVVKKNNVALVEGTGYTIAADGLSITFIVAVAAADSLTVDYSWDKDTHDIYQVAMFTDKLDGKMFNISGIGPVTKDKNTGMRITWSVTY